MNTLGISNLFSVKDKVVIITGGTSGIGSMLVEGFLVNEAAVVFCGRNKDAGMQTYKELRDKYPQFSTNMYFVTADMNNASDRKNLIQKTLSVYSGLNILINNAGVSPINEIKYYTDIINTNLISVINFSQECLPYMKTGSIINIASIADRVGPFLKKYVYSASKAGVITFTKQFSSIASKKLVTVNSISPGIVNTRLSKPMLTKLNKKVVNSIPFKRICRIQDIVGTALFLASEAGSYITGEDIRLDGGVVTCK